LRLGKISSQTSPCSPTCLRQSLFRAANILPSPSRVASCSVSEFSTAGPASSGPHRVALNPGGAKIFPLPLLVFLFIRHYKPGSAAHSQHGVPPPFRGRGFPESGRRYYLAATPLQHLKLFNGAHNRRSLSHSFSSPDTPAFAIPPGFRCRHGSFFCLLLSALLDVVNNGRKKDGPRGGLAFSKAGN